MGDFVGPCPAGGDILAQTWGRAGKGPVGPGRLHIRISPTPNPAPRGGELFLVSFFAGRRPRKMTRMGFPPPSAAGSLIKCRFLKGIRPQKTTQISFPIPLPGGRMVGVFDQGESDHYPINHLINNYDRVMVTKAAGLGF